MKKQKDYTIPLLLSFIIILCCVCMIFVMGCYDTQSQAHEIKESVCPYDGVGCPNVKELMRDYQIQLHMDTVWVYDGDRLVGSYLSTWENQIDTILINDNQ